MTQKFSAARKRAFLQYLAETGNATLACERAKVSRSWALLHRKEDAAFAAAWEGALREARERLRASPHANPSPSMGGVSGPADRWKFFNGHELVVRGTGGSGGGKRVQVGRARLKQWTPRVERRFLAALAATCNVRAAAQEVGMWPGSAYNHRIRWPAFARAWDEAIETGYVRIELALVEAGCRFLSPPEEAEVAPADVRVTDMTVWHALHLLRMHQFPVRGVGRPVGVRRGNGR